MPGLQLKIGADVTEATSALKTVVTEAQSTATKVSSAFGNARIPLGNIKEYAASINALKHNVNNVKFKPLPPIEFPIPLGNIPKIDLGLSDVPKQVKPAMVAISALGENIETLRAKALAKQQFLFVEKDIAKVAVLNKEIEILTAEIIRLGNVGKAGFDPFGNKIIKVRTEIDALASQIKKGTGSFTVLGKAGQLTGSTLGSLTGVLTTTRSQIPPLVAQTDKLKTGFLSVAGGASKAFSILRQAAFILPGIGIAGLISGLTGLVAGLFRTGTAAAEAAEKLKEFIKPISELKDAASAGAEEELAKVTALSNAVLNQSLSYKERNAALNQLKEINKSYFGDLTVETAALGLLKQRVDEYTNAIINAAVVKGFTDEIGKLSVELNKQESEFNKAFQAKKKFDDQLAKGGGILDQIGKPTLAFEKQSKVVAALRNQMFELRKAVQEAVNVSLEFKPLEEPKIETKDASDQFNKIISKAKQVADFLKDAFVITYQFSPLDTPAQALQKAQKFLDEVSKGDLKLLIRIGSTFSEPPTKIEAQKYFDPFEEQLKKLQQMSGEILAPTGSFDPSIIRAMQDWEDAQKRLAIIQKNAIATAAVINGALTPAFDNLFNAIQAGENPLQAFFQGLGQAVLDLIKKLIQAAITAAILSAIIPGGAGTAGGFGAIFKGLFGLSGGGIITGPTLAMVGEGSGTSLSNPEVVAPLDQLKSMLADLNMGPGRLQVAITGRLRNREIILGNSREQRSQRRLGVRR